MYPKGVLRQVLFAAYTLVAAGLGGFFIWLVLQRINASDVVSLLEKADVLPLGAAVGFILAAGVFRAYRWRLLLQADVAAHRLFLIEQTGIAVNSLSFLRIFDELVRLGILTTRDDVPAGEVLASEAMQRTLDLTATTVVVGAGALYLGELRDYRVGTAAALGGALLAVALLFTVGPRVAEVRLFRRAGFIRQFAKAAESMRERWRRSLGAFFLTLGSTNSIGLSGWMIAMSLHIHINPFAAIVITEAIRFFVGFAPKLPLAVGTMEAGAIGLLGLWGVSASAALTFALGLRVIFYVPSYFFALGFLASEGLLSAKAFQELGKEHHARTEGTRNRQSPP